MKPITFLFNSFAFAFCLSVTACLSADNADSIASGADAAWNHRDANSVGTLVSSDSNIKFSGDPGDGMYQTANKSNRESPIPGRTFDMTISAPIPSEDEVSGGESDPDSADPNLDSAETPKQTPMSINRASHLIGTNVKNQNGETLGVIRDVVFKFQSGRVTYVVLEKAAKSTEDEANVAVPLSAFTPSSDHKTLILNVERSRFEHAHGFSKNDLPDMNDPIYGAEPKQRILIIPVPVSPDHPGLDQDESQDPEGKPIPRVNPRAL